MQDMRLIKLSWIYSLETPGALELFRESGFLEASRTVLPDTVTVRRVLEIIDAFSRSSSRSGSK